MLLQAGSHSHPWAGPTILSWQLPVRQVSSSRPATSKICSSLPFQFFFLCSFDSHNRFVFVFAFVFCSAVQLSDGSKSLASGSGNDGSSNSSDVDFHNQVTKRRSTAMGMVQKRHQLTQHSHNKVDPTVGCRSQWQTMYSLSPSDDSLILGYETLSPGVCSLLSLSALLLSFLISPSSFLSLIRVS
jgi:hypothetical protein